MKCFTILLLMLILSACTSRKVPYSEGVGMVKSINGEVMYSFDTSTHLLSRVINFYQRKNGYYMSFINRDTLEVGEAFEGEVMLSKDARIHITAPIDTTITDGYRCAVHWLTKEVGEYEFTGDIEFEDRTYDLQWKFIVVPLKGRTNILKFEEEVVQRSSPFRF